MKRILMTLACTLAVLGCTKPPVGEGGEQGGEGAPATQGEELVGSAWGASFDGLTWTLTFLDTYRANIKWQKTGDSADATGQYKQEGSAITFTLFDIFEVHQIGSGTERATYEFTSAEIAGGTMRVKMNVRVSAWGMQATVKDGVREAVFKKK